jgi:hypothetical protein
LMRSFPWYLRTFWPRKSKPSAICVITVLAGERRKPRPTRTCSTTGLTSCSNTSLERPVIRKSRVKEWFSDCRPGLSVAAGFPLAVAHEPNPGQVALPFPSHRTFRFPEYGGPTVFTVHRAQVSPRTPAGRCRYKPSPSHTACCSDSGSIRSPGLYFSGSSSDESEC